MKYWLLLTGLWLGLFSTLYAQSNTANDSMRLYNLKEVVLTGSRVEISRHNVPMTVSVRSG